MQRAPARPSIAILLSTYDGAAFLPEQLASFRAQDDVDWTLWWRDDGSADGSVAAMEAFAAEAGCCHRVDETGHLGVTASYMALLRAAMASGADLVAYADQDDVWLPGKLARAAAALQGATGPVLYCSRQVLVDQGLQRMGESEPIVVPPGLGPALTQNIATGCTVMMNPEAAALVAASEPSPSTLHDWWSYLLVSAAGGRVIADDAATVLYRQHQANAVGAPRSRLRRAVAALERGPHVFMGVLRDHVAALRHHTLSAEGRSMVEAVARALAGGMAARLGVLIRYPLVRQTRVETWLFRWWFLVG